MKTIQEVWYLVICKNIGELIDFVKKEQETDEDDDLSLKIGMDKCGKHFKIPGNLVQSNPLKAYAPKNLKNIKWHHKDSSVKATFLLAVVEDILETWKCSKDLGKIRSWSN